MTSRLRGPLPVKKNFFEDPLFFWDEAYSMGDNSFLLLDS